MLVLTLHLLNNNAQRTAYWVMFAHPKVYEYTRVLFSYPLVEETFHVVDGILRNTAIVSFGVDGTAALLGSDKWVAQIICGTLAGCGGGIWMGNNWNQQFDHSMLSASHNINQCTQIHIRCIPFDTSSVVLFNTSSVASLVSGHESDFCGGSLLRRRHSVWVQQSSASRSVQQYPFMLGFGLRHPEKPQRRSETDETKEAVMQLCTPSRIFRERRRRQATTTIAVWTRLRN